jgi:hypothetical protein
VDPEVDDYTPLLKHLLFSLMDIETLIPILEIDNGRPFNTLILSVERHSRDLSEYFERLKKNLPYSLQQTFLEILKEKKPKEIERMLYWRWYKHFYLINLKELQSFLETVEIEDDIFRGFDEKNGVERALIYIGNIIEAKTHPAEYSEVLTKAQTVEFIDRLAGPEGCAYEFGNARCAHTFKYSKKILTEMEIASEDQDRFLEECKKLDGYCDCEILMNTASYLLGERTPW